MPTRYDGEGLDFIVVRENIEDLYAGVEYLDSRDVAIALNHEGPDPRGLVEPGSALTEVRLETR